MARTLPKPCRYTVLISGLVYFGRRKLGGGKSKTHGSEGVDNRDNSRRRGEALALLSRDQGLRGCRGRGFSSLRRRGRSKRWETDGELVDVDDGAPESRLVEVVVAHTNLTEVTGVVLVKVGAVVVLTTGL